MKKKIFNILGTLFLMIGLGLFAVHFYNQYVETKNVNKLKDNFMMSLEDPVEADEDVEFDTWGLLIIDSVDIELPITISDNFDDLYSTLIAYDTAPIPPEEGNFTIAGHNGSCPVCTFRYLHDVENGDEVKIINKTHTLTYEVYESLEVLNTETWVLDPVEDETTLSLLTCKYSSWTNPWRLIVRARLVDVKTN
ncbi:MAG TPA: sortase [Erysipelothrix sp.]|nr:sortase [Erysipelothrix sp.]